MKRSIWFYACRLGATVAFIGAMISAIINQPPSVVTALAALSLGFGALAVLYEY